MSFQYADGDKKVDMEEFLAVSAICAATSTQAGEMVKSKGGSVESLSAIFNLLDKDGSSVISKEELYQFLKDVRIMHSELFD